MIRVTEPMLDAAKRSLRGIPVPDGRLELALQAALAEIELGSSRELEARWQVSRGALANMVDRQDRNGMPDPVHVSPGERGWRVWQMDVMDAWRADYQPLVGRAAPAWGTHRARP